MNDTDYIELDIFDRNGVSLGKKRIYHYDKNQAKINHWLRLFYDKTSSIIAIMHNNKTDFQHNMQVRITIKDIKDHTTPITIKNLIPNAIYFSVRHCIPATWLNDRDQFLYPNDKWQKDSTFQSDCLAFMLFHGQNRITSKEGMNHFIPFSEKEVGAKEAFQSHFMRDFIKGNIKQETEGKQQRFKNEDLYVIPTAPLEFSAESQAVFKAGLELWKYYHSQEFKDSKTPYNPQASLYDIKAHFQGFNDKGKMNPPQKSDDLHYKNLLGNLNYELDNLAKKIEPKVYEYGFLKE